MSVIKLLVAISLGMLVLSAAIWILASPTGFNETVELIKTLVQVLGAVGLAGSLIFTFQTVRASQETLELSRLQHQFDQQTGVASRYHQALELFNEDPLLRNVGAFESLKRLALDHPDYHAEVVSVIAATVRALTALNPNESNRLPTFEMKMPSHDVALATSILNELGPPPLAKGKDQISLAFTDLRGMTLLFGNLGSADFRGSRLQGITALQSNLAGADFSFADLKGAKFLASPLQHATMKFCDLGEAWFVYPTMDAKTYQGVVSQDEVEEYALRAQFFGKSAEPNLTEGLEMGKLLLGLDLWGARLTGAHLEDADLRGVKNLTWEQVNSALRNERTLLPSYLTDSQSPASSD